MEAPLTTLHCWHCGATIGQATVRCEHCGTDLLDRGAADLRQVRYAVVGGALLSGARPRFRSMREIAQMPARGNFIGRQWRGELALDVSFWMVTVLGALAILSLPVAVATAIVGLNEASSIFDLVEARNAAVMGGTIALGPIGIWQVVGTWRAASRWVRYSPRPAWGNAARVMLIVYGLGCLVLCGMSLYLIAS